ncbi:hypothetical protein ACOMHN_015546 [Nucella lapillus]
MIPTASGTKKIKSRKSRSSSDVRVDRYDTVTPTSGQTSPTSPSPPSPTSPTSPTTEGDAAPVGRRKKLWNSFRWRARLFKRKHRADKESGADSGPPRRHPTTKVTAKVVRVKFILRGHLPVKVIHSPLEVRHRAAGQRVRERDGNHPGGGGRGREDDIITTSSLRAVSSEVIADDYNNAAEIGYGEEEEGEGEKEEEEEERIMPRRRIAESLWGIPPDRCYKIP